VRRPRAPAPLPLSRAPLQGAPAPDTGAAGVPGEGERGERGAGAAGVGRRGGPGAGPKLPGGPSPSCCSNSSSRRAARRAQGAPARRPLAWGHQRPGPERRCTGASPGPPPSGPEPAQQPRSLSQSHAGAGRGRCPWGKSPPAVRSGTGAAALQWASRRFAPAPAVTPGYARGAPAEHGGSQAGGPTPRGRNFTQQQQQRHQRQVLLAGTPTSGSGSRKSWTSQTATMPLEVPAYPRPA